uniref:Putative immuno cystatin n=1 Tax=Ixodes ricinus TaxID=34613 RepID=A0A090XAT0_IXORI
MSIVKAALLVLGVVSSLDGLSRDLEEAPPGRGPPLQRSGPTYAISSQVEGRDQLRHAPQAHERRVSGGCGCRLQAQDDGSRIHLRGREGLVQQNTLPPRRWTLPDMICTGRRQLHSLGRTQKSIKYYSCGEPVNNS